MTVNLNLAVHERLILAGKGLIQSLLPAPTLFPDLTATQVWDQIVENPAVTGMPAILITIEGVKCSYEAIDYVSDAVMRPVVYAVIDTSDELYTPARPKHLKWAESLARVFRLGPTQGQNPILNTVPEVTAAWLEMNPVIDKNVSYYQYFKTGFVIRYRCIEARGIANQ